MVGGGWWGVGRAATRVVASPAVRKAFGDRQLRLVGSDVLLLLRRALLLPPLTQTRVKTRRAVQTRAVKRGAVKSRPRRRLADRSLDGCSISVAQGRTLVIDMDVDLHCGEGHGGQ